MVWGAELKVVEWNRGVEVNWVGDVKLDYISGVLRRRSEVEVEGWWLGGA